MFNEPDAKRAASVFLQKDPSSILRTTRKVKIQNVLLLWVNTPSNLCLSNSGTPEIPRQLICVGLSSPAAWCNVKICCVELTAETLCHIFVTWTMWFLKYSAWYRTQNNPATRLEVMVDKSQRIPCDWASFTLWLLLQRPSLAMDSLLNKLPCRVFSYINSAQLRPPMFLKEDNAGVCWESGNTGIIQRTEQLQISIKYTISFEKAGCLWTSRQQILEHKDLVRQRMRNMSNQPSWNGKLQRQT